MFFIQYLNQQEYNNDFALHTVIFGLKDSLLDGGCLLLFKHLKTIKMSRITKEIATATAIALLKPKHNRLKDLRQQLSDKVTEAYLETVPHAVVEQFKKYPEYFRKASSVRFNCPGFNYEYYTTNAQVPDTNSMAKIGTQQGNKILALSAKLKDAESDYKSIKNEIEVALYAFRTYANVEKEFPEAFVLLPSKVSQAIMVNIDSIRKNIK